MFTFQKILFVGTFFSILFSFSIEEVSAQKKKTGQAAIQPTGPYGAMYPGAQQGYGPQNSAASRETYTIVEVDRQYQPVTSAGMRDLKKRIEEEFKTATKSYQLAKKDKNNKSKLEKPEKKTIKIVKSGIKGIEKAQEEIQKLLQEREKKSRKSKS